MLTRLGLPLVTLLLAGPIVAGLLGTILPAFGYLPALGGVGFSLGHFRQLFDEPGIWSSAMISLGSGLATTAVSLGVVLFFVAAFAGTPLFRRIQHLISPLLSVPHAAAAFGLAFLIAPSGMIARILSPELTGWERPPDLLIVNDPMGLAMIAGLIVKEIPFLLLITLAALPQVDLTRSRMLAASLGYGRIAGFVFGSWPPIYRQIRLAVFAVIAFSTSVVDVAAILGPTTPAPLAVQADAVDERSGTVDALLRVGRCAAATRGHGDGAADLDRRWNMFRPCCAGGSSERAGGSAATARSAMLRWRRWCCRPLRCSAGWPRSACGRSPGFGNFPMRCRPRFTGAELDERRATHPASARNEPARCFAVDGDRGYCSRCSACCAKSETGRQMRRGALALIYLPLIVPQVAFLFGLQLLFVSGSAMGLPSLVLAHLVFVLPYVFLSLSDPWRAYDRRYETVAAGLGKGRLATLLHVRLPMLLRAILTAAAVGFAVSIGQYLPTLLIGAGRLTTVTTEAVALASGGNRRVIGVFAFLQMALPALGFLVATGLPALIFRNRRAMHG